jgi:hypothetical protein
MRLYHPHPSAILFTFRSIVKHFSYPPLPRDWLFILKLLVVSLPLVSCLAPVTKNEQISINLTVDGGTFLVQLPAGSTVQQAIDTAGLKLNTLDRTEPTLFTALRKGDEVRVIRVVEEFSIEQVVIPYERRVLRNESLPEGESRLMQPGVNGAQEITYRRVFEDGKEVSNSPVKSVVLQEPVPEIVMIGSQLPFASYPIPGRLVYLAGGYAWMIEGSTGERRPVIATGDLDGRIFSLSRDKNYLLFTRRPQEGQEDTIINTLWVAQLSDDPGEETLLFDLKISNVVHFADWRPSTFYTIAYSTVESRTSAPGWQANNDLRLVSFNPSGLVRELKPLLDTNMGGKYGWWGTTYAWSPDGKLIAYARPDGVGLVDPENGVVDTKLDIIPLLTRSEWAWVPGISWGPDGLVLYTVDHAPAPGVGTAEESPLFDQSAIPMQGGPVISLVPQAGMFAYPLPSPVQSSSDNGSDYQLAFLQAIFPSQSESSRYQIELMDRDGSNRHTIFPETGAPGMQPQIGWGAWSPKAMEETGSFALAVIYQDNLWLVDISAGIGRQITGDGLVTRVDWK